MADRPAVLGQEVKTELAEEEEEVLVARLASERRAGEDDPELVDALLRQAAGRNRAALDRLAK